MNKPNKSILKRVKITGTGKLIRRKSGQNHFNSKESRRVQRRKKARIGFPSTMVKKIKAIIS